VAVASAGPYANLHCTAPQTDNHTSTPPLSLLQAECPSCRPTDSAKALKASKKYYSKKLLYVQGLHLVLQLSNTI